MQQQKRPRINPFIIVAALVLLMMVWSFFTASGTTGSTISYSKVMSYFENQQVTAFSLDLNTGVIRMSLKEGAVELPEQTDTTESSGGLLSGMLAVVLVVGLMLTAGVRTTVAQINSIDFDKINGAINNASQIVDQVSRLDLGKIDGAVDALTEAAGNLSSVDMASINQAVGSLGGAAENLGKLDIEKLNKTVGTLQTVVDNLNAVAEKLRNPFGR